MWLQDTGKQQLIFDDIPDYYFYAEVEEISNFEEILNFGRITITFIADPFKKGINEVGNEAWDTFNFETDYMQDIEFDVNGTKTISLYNPGRIVAPLVNCTSSITVINNGYTANFIAGDNKDWRLKLQPGANTLSINGTGHIKFIFRKELL
jgi:phage-related protein